ncbi:hypothetical protein CAE01nite_12550 [Cellulomonas aerilata]|uniref:Threonyl/alanyl tRNA synthetase SAD domain-containing protein n=1 Tax=Cellulomonas aerilata TaxID=515326 RepID=A0A512DBC0_9CELL|nr:hypothetical protein CAE01nite_12550 [Cellulomonas aerilata]
MCELPAGRTDIACGGTHVHDLTALGGVTTSLRTGQVEGGLELTMETDVTAP